MSRIGPSRWDDGSSCVTSTRLLPLRKCDRREGKKRLSGDLSTITPLVPFQNLLRRGKGSRQMDSRPVAHRGTARPSSTPHSHRHHERKPQTTHAQKAPSAIVPWNPFDLPPSSASPLETQVLTNSGKKNRRGGPQPLRQNGSAHRLTLRPPPQQQVTTRPNEPERVVPINPFTYRPAKNQAAGGPVPFVTAPVSPRHRPTTTSTPSPLTRVVTPEPAPRLKHPHSRTFTHTAQMAAGPPPPREFGPRRVRQCSPPPPPVPNNYNRAPTTMFQLREEWKQDCLRRQSAGRITVATIPTYQGRVDDSINGCAVIAALCAAWHLRSGRLDVGTIVNVIDKQCGPLLRQIRSKVNLGMHSCVAPSDVHDHLTELKILKEEQFGGVSGGNILNDKHLSEFVKLLGAGEQTTKVNQPAAATLFFREHVISIVKTIDARNGFTTYCLIDSMPMASNRHTSSRTTCRDMESLHVLLKWHCTRKLSDSECESIDRKKWAWDDSEAASDARVFQGFVWRQR